MTLSFLAVVLLCSRLHVTLYDCVSSCSLVVRNVFVVNELQFFLCFGTVALFFFSLVSPVRVAHSVLNKFPFLHIFTPIFLRSVSASFIHPSLLYLVSVLIPPDLPSRIFFTALVHSYNTIKPFQFTYFN